MPFPRDPSPRLYTESDAAVDLAKPGDKTPRPNPGPDIKRRLEALRGRLEARVAEMKGRLCPDQYRAAVGAQLEARIEALRGCGQSG